MEDECDEFQKRNRPIRTHPSFTSPSIHATFRWAVKYDIVLAEVINP